MIMNEDAEDAIERLAYRLIRRETRRFNRTTTDSELANYVRGIVDLQTELYGEYIKTGNLTELYGEHIKTEDGMNPEHYSVCEKCGYDYEPSSGECYKCVKSESEDKK